MRKRKLEIRKAITIIRFTILQSGHNIIILSFEAKIIQDFFLIFFVWGGETAVQVSNQGSYRYAANSQPHPNPFPSNLLPHI
jgi:hypothetical protein